MEVEERVVAVAVECGCGVRWLRLGDEERHVAAPCRLTVPGGAWHAMTPLTPRVLLLYGFRTGPRSTIEYTFAQHFLEPGLVAGVR